MSLSQRERDGFLHHLAEGLDTLGRGHIRSGIEVSPRFLAGDRMLSEDGAYLDLMRLRRAIGLSAFAALQFLMSLRGAGSIGGDVDAWRLVFSGGQVGAQESLGQRTDVLSHPRELSGVAPQAGVGVEEFFGVTKRMLGCALTDQLLRAFFVDFTGGSVQFLFLSR